MLFRQRLRLEGMYTWNQVAYDFAGTDWQHILYDRSTNDQLITQPEIYLGSTTNTAMTEIGTKRFIYPFPLESFAKFEGEVNGNVRVKLYSSDLELYAYLDRIKIALRTLDEDRNERLLAEYSFDASWRATKANEGYDCKSFDYTFDFMFVDSYVGARSFMFFFTIDADKTDNERLVMDVTLFGHVVDHASVPTAFFALFCEPGKKDLALDLPVL